MDEEPPRGNATANSIIIIIIIIITIIIIIININIIINIIIIVVVVIIIIIIITYLVIFSHFRSLTVWKSVCLQCKCYFSSVQKISRLDKQSNF